MCDRARWLNGPLRFENEPARHKLLDLLGDLALLGALPCAHVVAWKASHALHVRMARLIAAAQAQGRPEVGGQVGDQVGGQLGGARWSSDR